MSDKLGITSNVFEQIKQVGDSLSVIVVIGTLLQLLPYMAALVTVVWTIIRIYETRTFQHWNNNRLMRMRARKLIKLRAKSVKAQAALEAMEHLAQARVEARDIISTAATTAAKLSAAENVKVEEKSIIQSTTPLKE
jgi:hypothetical protein